MCFFSGKCCCWSRRHMASVFGWEENRLFFPLGSCLQWQNMPSNMQKNSQNKMQQVFLISASFPSISAFNICIYIYIIFIYIYNIYIYNIYIYDIYIYIYPQLRLGVDIGLPLNFQVLCVMISWKFQIFLENIITVPWGKKPFCGAWCSETLRGGTGSLAVQVPSIYQFGTSGGRPSYSGGGNSFFIDFYPGILNWKGSNLDSYFFKSGWNQPLYS